MSAGEASALPGGATGLHLFLLGSAALLVPLIVLVLAGFQHAQFGAAGWLIPGWGLAGIGFAFGLRRYSGAFLQIAARTWLVIGFAGLLFVALGTRVQVA